jgi:hypothetical protein
MTTYCVDSAATGAGTGTTWTDAKTSVAAALAIAAAGDIIQVKSTHNFLPVAAITWTPPAGGVAIISVTPSGASGYSAFTPGAAESVGNAASAFTISGAAGSGMYINGMVINGGTAANAACIITLMSAVNSQSLIEAVNCTFDIKTSAAATINIGAASGTSGLSNRFRAKGCTFIRSGSNTATFILMVRATAELVNPTFSMTGASKPAALFGASNKSNQGHLIVRDADLTGHAATGYFDLTNWTEVTAIVENCKLHATPTLTTGTWGGGNGSVLFRNCDSADTTYTFVYVNSYGTLTAENTDYVTTGGAQFNGAPVAWKVITTALATEFNPFILPPLAIWNTTVSAQTADIEIAQVNGATAFTDRQIWSDIDFAASASFPNYTNQSNRNAQPFLGTGAAHATSTNTWTVPNIGASPVKQKLQNTFTAAETGLLTSQIKVGIASTTLWVNPAIDGVT